MIKFQENARTDGRTDGTTDIPYFIGPFQLSQGVQQMVARSTNIYLLQYESTKIVSHLLLYLYISHMITTKQNVEPFYLV